MSDNWVVQNLENALDTWNGKLSEIYSLVTQSPADFKGGAIWNIITNINGALQAIGFALLVLFFVMGVVKKEDLVDTDLSVEKVRASVPRTFRDNITEDFLEKLEEAMKDPEAGRIMKDNFLTYSKVLEEFNGTIKIWDYVYAIKFISYKLLGYTLTEAFTRVFPNRVEKLVQEGSERRIASLAKHYNQNKLVNKIYQQTMIPSYVLNAPLFQEALDTLAEMIRDDNVRGMAKVKACETILSYTKPPEVTKAEVEVKVSRDSTIDELRDIAERFSKDMQKAISNGQITATEAIESDIINIDYEEVVDGSEQQ